ncbi:MAG: hypothetical protein IT454_21105 [Planctomycetes bacterium]|nr:hypothetical protein [Planctomycetota bacterium]
MGIRWWWCASVAVLLANVALARLAGEWAEGESVVGWKAKRIDVDAAPAEFPAAACETVRKYAPWAREHGYKLELDERGRALVVVHKNASASTWLKHFDGVFELLEREAADSAATESEPLVMFVLKTEVDARSLVARLAEQTPYLAAWASSAKDMPGFALELPLVGSVTLGARDQKEWDPDNEFVHRTAELALLRRFGRQPYWLLEGWAWHVEIARCKSVYCFPYRGGFVGIGEHGGWDKLLRDDWSDPAATFSIDEVAALRRGIWDARAARQAWGTLEFLTRHHPGALTAILRELHGIWDRDSRRDIGGGSWERITDFEVPRADQLRVLESLAGPLSELRRFFELGSAYRAPQR